MHDGSGMSEHAHVHKLPVPVQHRAHAPTDRNGWLCTYTLEKWTQAHFEAGMPSSQTLTGIGNLQLIGGASVFWQRLITISASTSSTGAGLQAFSTANAVIGVSSSTAAPAAANTYLAATSSNDWQGMTASSYPNHTDSVSSTGARTCQFQAQWTATQGNHSWQSWMVRSHSSSGSGRALNHALASLGTKTTGTWTLTVDLTLTT